MDTDHINKRLNSIVAEIQLIYQLVNDDEPRFPDEAQELLKSRVCLECGLPIAANDRRAKRGCHEKCHRRILRAIDSGKYTEFDAISNGKLAPSQTGGRPPALTSLERIELKSKNIKIEKKKHDAPGRKKPTKKD